MTQTLNQIIIVFLYQNQNMFFSNIGNQNNFLEKNHNPPPPFQVKWSFPNGIKGGKHSPMLPTFKNQHFTFDLTQIQVVSFQCNHIFLFKTTRSSNMASDYPNICWFLLTFSILQYLIGFIFFISQCSNSFGIYVLLNHTSVDWFPSLVVLHLHITFILRIPGES